MRRFNARALLQTLRIPRAAWPIGGLCAISIAALGAASLTARPHAGAAATATAPTAVPTATATVRADDASALVTLSLAPQFRGADAQEIAGMAMFAAIMALPTATPVPPTMTPTPRPPAPRAAAPAAPRKQAATARPPAPPAPAPAASGLDTSAMNGFEQTLFNDTNARRASAGLPPLRLNMSLVGVARIRSNDMAANHYFAHTSPVTGDTAFSLMDKYGIPYGWAGENLAENNYPDGQCTGVADDALWNSPPHRENILGAHYTQMGVGFARDASGMNYWTVVFTS